MYGDIDSDIDALFTDEERLELDTEVEDILEFELFCATAYPPDIAVLVIIDTTNASETTRTNDLLLDIQIS